MQVLYGGIKFPPYLKGDEMIKKIDRKKLPIRFKIYDSNWSKGIIIGNTVIFNGKSRKEVKQIKAVFQKDHYTHGFYVEYKDIRKLFIIYLRD